MLLRNYKAFEKSDKEKTKKVIRKINEALEYIRDDLYYPVIPMTYFDGRSREAVAEELGMDVSTITRNKKRLLDAMAAYLFSDEYVKQLME